MATLGGSVGWGMLISNQVSGSWKTAWRVNLSRWAPQEIYRRCVVECPGYSHGALCEAWEGWGRGRLTAVVPEGLVGSRLA